MPACLLISLVNWDSLTEIPALLNKGGYDVDVFCVKNSWAIQNKYYRDWIEAPVDVLDFVSEIINYIIANGHKYDWIIPGDDGAIRVLNDAIRDEGLFRKVMPLTDMANRDLLGSKAGFSRLCSQYNIRTPRYMIYDGNMSPKEIGEYMGYPFMMKVDQSEGGYGVFLCEDLETFSGYMASVTNRNNMVFQQFIKGYDVNTEVLYKNGELLVYTYSRTTKIMGKFGVSTQRFYYHNTEVEQELVKMGRDLGLNGFGNVVFMYSEAERAHYLIEIDLRPNAWMHYGRFMGNDFSEAVRKIIRNDLTLIKPGPSFQGKEMTIKLYKKDVYRCILEKDVKGLLSWCFNGDGCWKFIPFYDGKLFRACTAYLFRSFWELVVARFKRRK